MRSDFAKGWAGGDCVMTALSGDRFYIASLVSRAGLNLAHDRPDTCVNDHRQLDPAVPMSLEYS